MDWLERHLAVFPDPEWVVVIGAGQGRDLPALLHRKPARLVLLEPQPRWADLLRRQLAEHSGTDVLECALDQESGTSTLKVFNFPELSSLQPDPALVSLLPGARQMLELPVSTRSLADLAKQLELDPGPNNWLIVDAPGIEASVLAGLEDPDLRRFFGHVVLRSARSGPRDNSTDIEHLAKAFRRREYAMLGDVDFSDGDWPRLHLQYVSHTARQKELGAELRTIQERARELLADKDALKERLREQNLDFQDRTSKLEVALRELTQDSESRVDSLQGELARVTKALKGQAFELSAAAEAFERHRQKLETELERTRDDLAAVSYTHLTLPTKIV